MIIFYLYYIIVSNLFKGILLQIFFFCNSRPFSVFFIVYLDKGNTTTYEWRYGEPPLSVAEPTLNFDFTDDNDDSEKNVQDSVSIPENDLYMNYLRNE